MVIRGVVSVECTEVAFENNNTLAVSTSLKAKSVSPGLYWNWQKEVDRSSWLFFDMTAIVFKLHLKS